MNPPVCNSLASTHPRQNYLLAALPDLAWICWQPYLEPLEVPLGKVLCHSGGLTDYVYFPTTAIISLTNTTKDGDSSEIAVVGNDGVVGIGLIMGGNSMPSQAVVQSAGTVYRLRSQVVKTELGRAGPVLSLLLRYTQSVISQLTLSAACNRHHSIDQQLARRLLVAMDRSASGELAMTQELAASLIGVRREGITNAALKLQQAGVIRYGRGQISVLNRAGLEKRTCECYGAAKRETERLLPMMPSLYATPEASPASATPSNSVTASSSATLSKQALAEPFILTVAA